MPEGKVGYHVANVKTLPRGITAYIKGNGSFVHQPGQPFRIGTLGKKPPPFEILQRIIHHSLPCIFPALFPVSFVKTTAGLSIYRSRFYLKT
jgi:hypothetical protein